MMKTKLISALIIAMMAVTGTSCNDHNNEPVSNNNQIKDGENADSSIISMYRKFSPFTYSIGGKITNKQAEKYDLIIVEPSSYNKDQVKSLKSTGAIVLGYLSVGEVGPYRYYFDTMKNVAF